MRHMPLDHETSGGSQSKPLESQRGGVVKNNSNLLGKTNAAVFDYGTGTGFKALAAKNYQESVEIMKVAFTALAANAGANGELTKKLDALNLDSKAQIATLANEYKNLVEHLKGMEAKLLTQMADADHSNVEDRGDVDVTATTGK